MKCILHIGTEKTGTTSLQEFFHLNREKLASLGYLYTRSAGLSNNESLPVAAFNADRRDGFTKRHGIFTDAELLAFQAKTIAGLKQEINNARNIHTVIFSSEQIQSRLKTDEELIRLKAILAELGLHEISVLVYLRSPVEIANSLYATAIKTGAVAEQPPAPDNEHWNNICNHRNTLVRFANIFGSSSLLPRLYGKQELLNGSIIDDFCAATGLPLAKATFLIPGPQNENLTVSGLEILRRLNRHIPVFDENQRPNPLRKDLLPFVTQHLNKGDKYGISAELRQQYQTAFNDSNEWVRAHYFPERPSLFGSVNIPPPSSQQFGADDLDQLACLIATLWKDKANAEQQLNKGASGPLARILKRLGSQLKHR